MPYLPAPEVSMQGGGCRRGLGNQVTQPACDLAAFSLQALSGQQLVLDLSVQEAPSGSVLRRGVLGSTASVLRKPIVLSGDIAALQLPFQRKLQLRVSFLSPHLRLHPRQTLRVLQVGISSIKRRGWHQPFKHGHHG